MAPALQFLTHCWKVAKLQLPQKNIYQIVALTTLYYRVIPSDRLNTLWRSASTSRVLSTTQYINA